MSESPILPDGRESAVSEELLLQCASEPIHVPGSIQPHGHLVAFDETNFSVRYASIGAHALFGIDADEFLGSDFRGALGPLNRGRLHATLASLHGGSPVGREDDLRFRLEAVEFYVSVHRQGSLVVLELEGVPHHHAGSPHLPARIFQRLQQAATLQALLDVAAEEVRRMTNCDRVVVYRLCVDGHGVVLSEAKADGMDAYLGLHFPASDIPAQARELYRNSWLRAIPDVGYVPVPVLADGPMAPLDMTHSVLRSVSPVHREYMRNMGLGASMSISLINNEQLWGLIGCGHRAPLAFAPELRSSCVALGRLLSVQIAAMEGLLESRALKAKDVLLLPVTTALTLVPEETLTGLGMNSDNLMRMVDATGVAVLLDDDVKLFGDCPPASEVSELVQWAITRMDSTGCFATSALASEYPSAECYQEVASGMVVMNLPKPGLHAVAWFRPEVSATVRWAGEPTKTVVPADEAGPQRLTPRNSFGEWRASARGKSLKWGSDDLYAVKELRRSAIEIDLGAQVGIAMRAVAAREEMVAVMSHDLRSPLSVVVLNASFLVRSLSADAGTASGRAMAAIQGIQRAASRMGKMLSDLLDMTLIENGRYSVVLRAVPVGELFADAETLLRPISDAKHLDLEFDAGDGLHVMADAERFYQVITNLVGNAVKFTPDGGTITVKATADVVKDMVQFTVKDTGTGIPAEVLERIFDRYWRVREGNPTGTGLGLHIVRGIVEAHGGSIRATSDVGHGATFYFTIPRVADEAPVNAYPHAPRTA